MVAQAGKIKLEDFSFDCIVGTLPEERDVPQLLVLDVEFELDFSKAARSEALQDTVDYANLSGALQNFITASKFQLLETLVWKAAEFLLTYDQRILSATVKARKPRALPRATVSAKVTLTREKSAS